MAGLRRCAPARSPPSCPSCIGRAAPCRDMGRRSLARTRFVPRLRSPVREQPLHRRNCTCSLSPPSSTLHQLVKCVRSYLSTGTRPASTVKGRSSRGREASFGGRRWGVGGPTDIPENAVIRTSRDCFPETVHVTRQMRAVHAAFLLLFVAVGAAMAQQAADWRTPAEKSGFVTTPNYEGTLSYLERLQKAAPGKIHLERFGTTAAGRPMMMVVASSRKLFTPEAARAAHLPVILLQAGIHSGEIEGKDAGLMLLRDFAVDGQAAASARPRRSRVHPGLQHRRPREVLTLQPHQPERPGGDGRARSGAISQSQSRLCESRCAGDARVA